MPASSRRNYESPPVVEATAEFRFSPHDDHPWDQTAPGLIYERLADTYTEKRQATTIDAQVAPQPDGRLLQTFSPTERLQLVEEDENSIVTLGPHYLAVTEYAPYRGWEDFSPRIKQAFDAYNDVVNPGSIIRLGLRYINRVEFEAGQPVDLSTILNFYPFIADDMPQNHSTFMCGVHFPYENGRDLARMQLADSTDGPALLIDIDYFLNRAGEVPINDADAWLVDAHTHVEELFESALTDTLRARFGVSDG